MNYKELNDYELLYYIREKDEDAYQLLYQKYEPYIDKVVRQYLIQGKKVGFDYDDLYQAGRMGVFYALTHYQEEDTLFYTYVGICVKGRIQNLVRLGETKKQQVLNEAQSLSFELCDGTVLEDLVGSTSCLLDTIITQELVTFLIQFEHTLSFPSSCIFELKMNGFVSCEIATLLSLSTKMVNNRLYQIKKKLVIYLKQIKYI